ncbi:CotH kinase family protein [Jidongwangia harbinensis]|uniref:CotH kinase family protein n=1 Tax=Jidongwangia harbinensis TaxID=2878561 RepID=UPI001CD9F5EF|nr:CotH kinase family protein [Jidongwangia harbinensis]MCA2211253.1 CotH kinase family protein [Jidongwangia harbinensis]
MTPPRYSAGRRLLHRVPVRVRHYWKLLAGCVAFVVALTVVFSTVRIQPYVTSGSDVTGDQITQDVAGSVDLFDATVAHRLELTFRTADYERMLDSYADEGEKQYLEADLTVDGTTVPSVGVRLKGNSTLGGLTRDGEPIGRLGLSGGRQPGPAQPGPAPPGPARGGPAQDGPAQGGAAQDGPAQGGAAQGGAARPGGGLARTALKAEEPEKLPWLIRFDEFVDGRRYQGHREIAVRVGGMGGGSTALNEAVTLTVLGRVGEVGQRYAYTGFTVNDRPTTARLIVEHPDENFAEDLGGRGVLYKSLAGGQFTDQGDDPTGYQDDFDQITMKGSQDLQPVIDLIRWVHRSSDAEFAARLDDRLDVRAFARYAALQNLLLNFDDMAGPGRNYYLWYDLGTGRFTVIGWDYNLTFSGDPEQGPHDVGRMGGLPAGAARPEGRQPPADQPPPGGQVVRGGPAGGHKLKERFLATPAFAAVYEEAYRELYRQIYAGGAALAAVDSAARVLATVDGHDGPAVSSEAGQLRTVIQQRTASLKTDEVVTGD